jgi:glycosyltransferase involved in cell wall biosynthesis
MLAYVFPPFYSVGGSIRVVKFIKYLPALGWLPVVLTIDDSTEYATQRKRGSVSLLRDISDNVRIYRTTAGEPSKEFLEKGRRARRKNWIAAAIGKLLSAVRQWAELYLPLADDNISWLPFAVRMGRQIVRKEGVEIIFATCPPFSVALIGAVLKRLTDKSLILDFRDDWIGTPWHRSKPWLTRWIERWLEMWAVKTGDRVILVTEWSRNASVARYAGEPVEKFVFIPNGCDLEDFASLKSTVDHPRNSEFTIVHAGLLCESEVWRRSPETFFQALCRLRQQYPDLAANLTMAFTGHLPETYKHMVEGMGLSGVVKEMGHLPREEFVHLLKMADLLLAINYEGFSTLIPGKIYEYWAVGGPPILLLSYQGAACDLVKKHRLGFVADPDDVATIEEAVLKVMEQWQKGEPMRISTAGIERYSREALTRKLAQVLHAVVGSDVLAQETFDELEETARLRASRGRVPKPPDERSDT